MSLARASLASHRRPRRAGRAPRPRRRSCAAAQLGDVCLTVSLLRIPVIGAIARGDQRLSCSMRGSIELRTEQFSR